MPAGAPSTQLTPPSEPMVWHGWGDPARRHGLPEAARAMLERELGPLEGEHRPVPLSEVRVRPSALTAEQRRALEQVVGAEHVRDDHRTRVEHAGGRSTPDLLRRRHGDATAAPDVVVAPRDHDEVAQVLDRCAEHRLAVVPFGGGTSVVGGVEPERGPFAALVTLDLGRLDALIELDETAGLATFGAGVRGPAAEAALRERGFTLGHFPQSYAYLSLGGAVATRSSGQASSGYGRIDELVAGLRCATPIGELRIDHGPRSAAGPDLRALLLGSEGILGVLTEVTVRVRPAPELETYTAHVAPSFASGAATLRALAQAGARADVTRLSDEDETRAMLAQAGGWQTAALERYLGIRGVDTPSLLILGWEGSREQVRRRRARTQQVLATRRTVPIGAPAGRAWAAGRFDGPYLRDELLDRGVLVDTLETATSWSRLGALYQAVRGAVRTTLRGWGTPPLLLTHISHLYPSGASLYLTWLARQDTGRELEQWQAVKQATGDAIMAAGGTITHHHAVGLDHRRWMHDEVGPVGLAALRAVKAALDPDGILNPGKLLPPDHGPA